MLLPRSLFCIAVLIACNPNRKAADPSIAQLRSDHNKRIELIRVTPEPFYAMIPDSMKKWIPVLRNVLADDQKYRIAGYDSFTREERNEQIALDSQNLKIVTSILDKHGWPGIYDVGLFGQQAIDACIQHSPLKVQEKYYPYLVEAYKKDSLLFGTLALLEDRINMKNHKCQYYGSQVVNYRGKQTLYPVVNIDSIDAIRERIGFKTSLEQYLEMLNVDWDINEYKRILPALKKEFNVSDTLGLHFDRK